MKKTISVFLAFVLFASIAVLPVGAAAPTVTREIEVIHTEYGDIEVETALIVYDSLLRYTAKSAKREQTFTHDGSVVATVTLYATFGFDGKTVWVDEASSSHSTSGGWSYKNEDLSTSGGTATLTAELSKFLYPDVPVELTLTCTKDGKIS